MANTTFSGPVLSQNGFQLPSFTNSQILATPNPETGLLVFNSTLNDIAYYTGTVWVGAVPPVAPSVSGISPPTGVEAGGTNVTISGSNFLGASAVTIGGTPVASFTVVSSTSITAVTAAHAAGASSVNVTNAGGTNAPNTLFTYAPPSVTYAAGVDYTNAGSGGLTFDINTSPTGNFILNINSWIDTAGMAELLSQPIGTVYTVVVSGPYAGTYTLTQSGIWNSGAGVSCSFAGWPVGAMMINGDVDSITFAPSTAFVTYAFGTEYTTGTNLFFDDSVGQLKTNGTWVNTTAQGILQSQPDDTIYTMVGSPGTGALFQNGTWSSIIGGYGVNGARTPPFNLGGGFANLTSISFSEIVNYTYGTTWANTYNVEYGSFASPDAFSINQPGAWTNTAASAQIIAQPIGTKFTLVSNSGANITVLTTTTVFNATSGPTAQTTRTGDTVVGVITGVSFTPA